ncbi:MAG TPA: radical SAM protein [Armatimonadetes bacterium]|nr:radical SAM protein [Armatimonadota bacterium]
MFIPAYQRLQQSGELQRRVERALSLLRECRVCPRACGVNRLAGEKGTCRVGRQAMVSSFGPHFGEESPLVGYYGSGTIFLTYCNLRCVFCQNYDISHLGHGHPVAPEQLANMMLALQARGCHNINFVTPTHVVPQLLEAIVLAAERDLNVPLVYNCGGYESVETLRLLDGVFDIYMPDFKYTEATVAKRLSGAEDYPLIVKAALKEMHRQVGDLVVDERGIALRGMIVRHLVLPNNLAGTEEAMRFLAEELSPHTYVNVMAQYRPCYRALEFPEIARRPAREEFRAAVQAALNAGLHRLA